MNTQFAVKNNEVYLIEVNPSKSTYSTVRIESNRQQSLRLQLVLWRVNRQSLKVFTKEIILKFILLCVAVVLPFNKFPALTHH